MSRKITSNPDKTRILMLLVNSIYTKMLYAPEWVKKQHDTQPGFLYENPDCEIKVGDLVTGMTSIWYNDFLVGYVTEVRSDGLMIREIGSDRVCFYSNERFLRIDKEILGEEILEGEEYKLYQKSLKAFSECVGFRYCGIKFDKNKVFLSARKDFETEPAFVVEFYYNSKTTIKSIVKKIENGIEEYKKKEEK